MTPASGDPIAIGEHVVSQSRRRSGARIYVCQSCGEKADHIAEFQIITCGDNR